MLLSSRQLTIGGQIVIKEFEGTVESIDLRAVKLRLFDGRVVTIPNGDVFNSAVISNTSNATRRREFRVSIGLQDNARRAIDLALRTVNDVDGVLDEPPRQRRRQRFERADRAGRVVGRIARFLLCGER